MLDRIDHEQPIESLQQFDDTCPAPMLSCKEDASIIAGYSPEQAVLGKATKLPASISSDENLRAHLTSDGTDLASDRFRQHLELCCNPCCLLQSR